MISNPRHGSPPRLMAHQPTRCSTTQESSARVHRPESVSEVTPSMTTGTPTPGGTGVLTDAVPGVTFTTSGVCATAGPTRAKDNRVAVSATLRMIALHVGAR